MKNIETIISMKKMFFLLMLLLSMMRLLAQNTLQTYSDVGIRYNIVSGLSNFDSYMSSDASYTKSYVPTFGVNYSKGLAIGTFSCQLDLAVNMGIGDFSDSQYKKKEDFLSTVRINYAIFRNSEWSIEPSIGLGLAYSTLYFATSRGAPAWNDSYSSTHMTLPLTLSVWNTRFKHPLGIFIQYMVNLGQSGSTTRTGLGSVVFDNLHIFPSTFSIGTQWRLAH